LRFLDFSLPAVAHGLDAAGVGAGVGWFGLAWLAPESTMIRVFGVVRGLNSCQFVSSHSTFGHLLPI
jgi:hypothetical protein